MPRGLADEGRLTEDIIELAREFGRYGYRMITGMLNNSGWHVNHKRVERIWRRDGGGSENSPGDCFPDDAESPAKTGQDGAALVERWILRSTEAGAAQPRLVL